MNKVLSCGVVIIGVCAGLVQLGWAEEVDLQTYYPSPRGVYKELKTTGETELAIQGGNVGIGTSSPTAKLYLKVNNSSLNGDPLLVPFQVDVLTGQKGGPRSVVIDPQGNVGIGTTAPTQRLHIAQGNLQVQGVENFTTSGNEAIVYLGDTNYSIRSVYGSGVKISTYKVPDALSVLQESGRVGLGTSTPTSHLDVRGGQIRLWSSDLQRIVELREDGSILHLQSVGAPLYLNDISKQNVYLNPNGGNVGVGITEAQARLHVGAPLGQNGPDLFLVQGLVVDTQSQPTDGGTCQQPGGVDTCAFIDNRDDCILAGCQYFPETGCQSAEPTNCNSYVDQGTCNVAGCEWFQSYSSTTTSTTTTAVVVDGEGQVGIGRRPASGAFALTTSGIYSEDVSSGFGIDAKGSTGVRGTSTAGQYGPGVLGVSTDVPGGTGVTGVGAGVGVHGVSNSNYSDGVKGECIGSQGNGVYGVGPTAGVHGISSSVGVIGESTGDSEPGVVGNGPYRGVAGYSEKGIGILGSGKVDFWGNGGEWAANGVWNNISDRNLKENLQSVDMRLLLDKINQLPIMQWNYKSDSQKIQHIGPTSQDFYRIFGLSGETYIASIDPAGVALGGMKALIKKMEEQEEELGELRAEINRLKARLDTR